MNDDKNKFIVEKPKEADLERLAREVKEVQKQPAYEQATPQEVIKESLKAFGAGSAPATDDDTAKPQEDEALLPEYMKTEERVVTEELAALVQLSINDGFEAGIKEARKHGGFMVDAVHDALVERVYPELKRMGILE